MLDFFNDYENYEESGEISTQDWVLAWNYI